MKELVETSSKEKKLTTKSQFEVMSTKLSYNRFYIFTLSLIALKMIYYCPHSQTIFAPIEAPNDLALFYPQVALSHTSD